jgi:nitrate/nitrite transporter NarK
MLSMCEELAGKEQAGVATGLLMLAGNAGAVLIIVLMPLVNGADTVWTNALYLMLFLMAITFLTVVFLLKESFETSIATN